jgi:hypothetical protein
MLDCSLYCYHFALPVLLREPPTVELPDPAVRPDWYGEVWLRYPLVQRPIPTHQALFFRETVGLRWILYDFTRESRGDSGSVESKLTLGQAMACHARMVAWYKNLPEPLVARNIVFPSHLKLQYVTLLCRGKPRGAG